MGDSLATIETCLREARFREARELFDRAPLPRGDASRALRLAELAYRVGDPARGLRILQPLLRSVRTGSRQRGEALVTEALCLSRLGAVEEALAILHTEEAQRSPRCAFAQGAARLAQWDAAGAADDFRRASASLRLRYPRLVAEVNLAAALVASGETLQSTALLRHLLHETSLSGYRLLQANVLEIGAQRDLLRKDWPSMEVRLRLAKQWIGDGALDGLFVDKWTALRALWKDGRTDLVEDVRKLAERAGHWETVRDLDRHRALALRDRPLALRVVFGTPNAFFREAFVGAWGEGLALPESYDWGDGPDGPVVDALVADGLSPAARRLLQTLVEERYGARRAGALFGSVFPGEIFRPEFGRARIHQLVLRLRRWLKERSLPIVVEAAGDYRLRFTGPVRLRLRAPERAADPRVFFESVLRRSLGEKRFGAREAARATSLPLRTVQRSLTNLVNEGVLLREGAGRAARYRFR